MRRALVVPQVLAVVVLGAATVARFHVWADVDERPHFDYVQAVAEDGRLPELTDLEPGGHRPHLARAEPGRPAASPAAPTRPSSRRCTTSSRRPPSLVAADHRRKVKVLRAFDLLLVLAAVALLWRLSGALQPADRLLAFSAGLVVVLWPGVLAVAVPRRRDRVAWGVVTGCSVLLAAVWIDMAGAFYFTDVGDTLGI